MSGGRQATSSVPRNGIWHCRSSRVYRLRLAAVSRFPNEVDIGTSRLAGMARKRDWNGLPLNQLSPVIGLRLCQQ